MTRLSAFIRSAPKLFYVIAAIDFLKNCLSLGQFFVSGTFRGMDYTGDIKLQLFASVLSAFVFSAAWIAYGVLATLLIAIYDEVAARRGSAEGTTPEIGE